MLPVSLFLTSQAFAADDVKNIAETLVKIYKLDDLANEYLFGSFAATDAEPTASTKFTNNGKKSSSSGFKIKGLKNLQYKLESLANEFLFGSFAAADAEPVASAKFTNNGKKSSSSGFKIKSIKKLHYKMDQNQFLVLRNDGLHYFFKFQF